MLAKAKNYSDTDKPVEYYRVNRLMNYLFASVLLTFLSGVLTYGEKFKLLEYAFSYIGMLRTPNGNPNTIAFLIFLTGNMFNSIICFKIKNLYDKKLDRLIFEICGIGFLMLMLPCDIINPVHSTGGAMVFGSLWIFSLCRIYEIYCSGKDFKAFIYFLLLNITILPYAYLYFINSPVQQIAQKPAIAGLLFTIKMVIGEHINNHQDENLKNEVLQ